MTASATRQPIRSDRVCEILGITRKTFQRYRNKYPDHFRTYKSGKWRVMDPEDLERWREYRKQQDL